MTFPEARENYIHELNADECMWHWQETQIALAIHKEDTNWDNACQLANEIMDKVFSTRETNAKI